MKTKFFYSNGFARLILFFGCHTIMLFGFVFSKLSKEEMSDTTRNHEMIHVAQYLECFVVGFIPAVFLIGYTCSLTSLWLLLFPFLLYYILYGIEIGISFVHHLFAHGKKNVGRAQQSSYLNSAMEMEAYENETDPEYIGKRSWCSFIKYYGKL